MTPKDLRLLLSEHVKDLQDTMTFASDPHHNHEGDIRFCLLGTRLHLQIEIVLQRYCQAEHGALLVKSLAGMTRYL